MSEDPSPPDSLDWPRGARARALAAVYLVVLFVSTHLPSPPKLPILSHWDKFTHLSAYASLTFAVLIGWELSTGRLQPKHYFAIWFVGTFYAAFDELTQIPFGRHADMHDWLADVIGILLGMVAIWGWPGLDLPNLRPDIAPGRLEIALTSACPLPRLPAIYLPMNLRLPRRQMRSSPYQLSDAAQAHEKRNFLVLALYQIVMRIGWIFKTESIVMPAVLDTITGGGPPGRIVARMFAGSQPIRA